LAFTTLAVSMMSGQRMMLDILATIFLTAAIITQLDSLRLSKALARPPLFDESWFGFLRRIFFVPPTKEQFCQSLDIGLSQVDGTSGAYSTHHERPFRSGR
jgi:hypothetical protein